MVVGKNKLEIPLPMGLLFATNSEWTLLLSATVEACTATVPW